MRLGNFLGIAVSVGIFLVPQTKGRAQWTITSPNGGSTRQQTSSVAGGGFATAGDTPTATFAFGTWNGTALVSENQMTVTRQNIAGMWFWGDTLVPPPGNNHRWIASPIDPMTGMPSGDHWAWIEDGNGMGDATGGHVVTTVP